MTRETAQPSCVPCEQPSKYLAPGARACRSRPEPAAAFLLRAAVAAAAVGAAACGWKTDYAGPTEIAGTTVVVEMQTQDGEPLGSRVFPPSSSLNTLTLADVGNRAGLSSQYIVIRMPPSGGRPGRRVGFTNTGSVAVPNLPDGTRLTAVFMSTADLPESAMDCFGGFAATRQLWDTEAIGIIGPGSSGPGGLTYLDGDETLLANAIDDINGALVDRQGVSFGRLSWELGNLSTYYRVRVGFTTSSPTLDSDDDPFSSTILINPTAPREVQATDIFGGLFEILMAGHNPQCAATGTYLADPANGYRLSRQGMSLIRFAANMMRSDYGW